MKTFSTTDFQASVILSALGFKLTSIDKSQPRYAFVFEDHPDIEKCMEDFYKGELKLDPKLVLLHQKLIKDRMYAGV